MTQRSLIVARLDPADAGAVAALFRQSDEGPLPAMVGVTHRSLYTYGPDLYFHLVEADGAVADAVDEVRAHPLYRELNDRLARFVRPFDPTTWRSPRDAMARSFYEWSPTGPRVEASR